MAYSTITKPSDYFNTLTWTGDSTTPKNIEGVGFQPDLIWGKIRSQAYSHQVYDTVRGFGNDKELTPNNTNAEGGTNAEIYGYLSGVTSDGFTAVRGTDPAGDDYWNESPETYVAWNWLAGGTAVSNTDGDITSSVSANTTSGFSIVSYTGNGSNSTVGHGLGVAPKVVIVKQRTTGSYNWVWGSDLLTDWGYILKLNLTDAEASTAGTQSCFNSTAPTSNVFTVGTSAATNNNTDNFIAYCFAEKKGFSKFGSYTGNGNADGTFVYTGFKPAFVIAKKSSNTSNWVIFDNKRDISNVCNHTVYANLSNAETTADAKDIDILSQGFKFRTNSAETNESGATFIYMAFAENPLVTSSGVPATAR